MNEETTWGSVNVGDVVEGSHNSLWAVVGRDQKGETTVANILTGKVATSKPDDSKPVVVVSRVVEQMPIARAIVQTVFNGEELASREIGNDWRTPAEYTHPGAYFAHLLIFHGMFGRAMVGRNLAQLDALHQAAHTPTGKAAGYTEHIHDPAYDRAAT
jgi:hypothetical protein